jgi:hypothetical protein
LDEEEQQQPMMNGHVEENVTTEVTSSHNDTKVVTKTTTVTETQVITEISGNKKGEKTTTFVNGSSSSHSLSSPEENKEFIENVEAKNANNVEEKIESPPPSENGSVQEISAESIKSPSKVKKSKSFKKTLMKKFKKDDK